MTATHTHPRHTMITTTARVRLLAHQILDLVLQALGLDVPSIDRHGGTTIHPEDLQCG